MSDNKPSTAPIPVTGFRAYDGQFFPTEEQATEYTRLLLAEKAKLAQLKIDRALIANWLSNTAAYRKKAERCDISSPFTQNFTLPEGIIGPTVDELYKAGFHTLLK